MTAPALTEAAATPEGVDVCIIGAGIVGCALARELAKYPLSVALIERHPDVGWGITKANSGVVHAGFNNPVGSKKARYCVMGNALFDGLCDRLGVPFSRIGKVVVAQNAGDERALEGLLARGATNDVPGLRLIDADELHALEPNIEAEAALLSNSTGIVEPYRLAVALATNAVRNGVHLHLESEVCDCRRSQNGFCIEVAHAKSDMGRRRTMRAEAVVNAAGFGAPAIARMLGDERFTLHPSRGEYAILDRRCSELLTRMCYPVPPADERVLGVHITPTISGNILLGPSAAFVDDAYDTATTRRTQERLVDEAQQLLPAIDAGDIITSYAGLRPKLQGPVAEGVSDFVIELDRPADSFVNLQGIESPGLTAAPAIARELAHELGMRLLGDPGRDYGNAPRDGFDPYEEPHVQVRELSEEEHARLVAAAPAYGEVVCRCETISRGEVRDAITGPVPARTVAGVKYRTRATMGRCQGGFCLPRIVALLDQYHDGAVSHLTLRGTGSELFVGHTKSLRCDLSPHPEPVDDRSDRGDERQ